MDSQKNIVSILWTGGWDSSYRMVELSRKEVIILPIYIYGNKRPSEQYERRAMSNILKELNIKKETIAEIRPIKFVHIKEIPLNKKITKAYNNIQQATKLGRQHEWLARYAYENPGIELGTELAPLKINKVQDTISKFGSLIYNSKTSTYILDKDNSSKDIMYVLGNFNFPIVDKTGREMLENIKEWGYEDVMKHVWVCYSPIFGKPCGTCHPCELKVETGMEFLMDSSSLKRYERRRNSVFRKKYNIEKRLSRQFDIMRFTKS